MKKSLVIIGAGITASRIFRFITRYNLYDVIAFAQDREYITKERFNGLPVLPIDDLPCETLVFIAFGWNRLNRERRDIFERMKSLGFKCANVVSPYASIFGTISGENCWIADGVITEFGSVVNSNVFLDHRVFIGTNTIVGPHCYLGVASIVAGGCTVGEQSFIGLSATIFDEVIIGNKCLLGACSIVKRSVPNFTVIKTKHDTCISNTYDDGSIETRLMANKNVR